MTRVRFLTPAGVLEVEAPRGGRLLDLCDEVHAPIRFACRSASCGTCLVAVRTGAEWLEPADHDEQDTLSSLGETGDGRLACVARLHPDGGLVILEVTA